MSDDHETQLDQMTAEKFHASLQQEISIRVEIFSVSPVESSSYQRFGDIFRAKMLCDLVERLNGCE